MVRIGEDDNKINDIVIEDNISTIDSKTIIDLELKSEGQVQGHKISIQKWAKQEFLVKLEQHWLVLQKMIRKLIIWLYRQLCALYPLWTP